MKVWTDKQGNKLTGKEFMTRWKAGINSVTPLQQTRSQLLFSYIVLLGVVGGLLVSIISWKSLWWLAIVLFGTLGIQILGLIGTYQKYYILKKIEDDVKGGMQNGF